MFKAFVIKEFRHILRDKRTLLILIGLPVVLIVLFGFAISTEVRDVKLGVLITDEDPAVTRIVDKISQSEYFEIKRQLHDDADIDGAMRRGDVEAVIVFGDDFSSRMAGVDGAEVSIIADATNPNNASTEVMYLSGIIQGYVQDEMEASGTLAGAGVNAASTMTGRVETNTRMLYNPQLRSAYNFVPGILGMIMIIVCALMTSVSIVKEKETGTMEVLLVSPVKPIAIVFAKMIPYFVLSCVILLIVFLLIVFILQVPVAGSLLWVIAVSLLYVMLALSIGLLVSTLVQTQIAATLITGMVFMIPVIMLSGMLYDVESMPLFFKVVSQVVPAKWYIQAIKKIMIEGLPVFYAMKEILVLVGMTALIFITAIRNFNNKLE